MRGIIGAGLNKPRNSYFKMRSVTTIAKTSLTIDDIPHPRSLPLFGTKLAFFASGGAAQLHGYVDRRHKQLGPIFFEKLTGNADIVFISDPVLMKSLFLNLEGKHPAHILPEPWVLYQKLYGTKRGLFFMDGEEWLNNRRVLNRHVLRDDAEKWLEEPIKHTIAKFVVDWETNAIKGNFVPNLESEFYKISTKVIINILLGSNSPLKPNKQYDMMLEMFAETVKKIFQATAKLYALPVHWCQRLNLKLWTEFKDSVDLSLRLGKKIVAEILSNRRDSNGLIQKLCDENMPEDVITRIVVDFVMAAGDTTAYTSLWIFHLLSRNEEVINEIRNKDLSFVKCVVKESMRLYPVAPLLTRILPKKSILGPYTLDEMTPIVASIYTSGRDEQNFSKADQFLPHRWDRNDPRKKDLVNHTSSASLPFALGARSCIGKKIAMLQITELVNQVVNNFEIKCVDMSEVKAITSLVLVPDKHIELHVSPRKSNTIVQ